MLSSYTEVLIQALQYNTYKQGDVENNITVGVLAGVEFLVLFNTM